VLLEVRVGVWGGPSVNEGAGADPELRNGTANPGLAFCTGPQACQRFQPPKLESVSARPTVPRATQTRTPQASAFADDIANLLFDEYQAFLRIVSS
jgi:hypothetical protein